MIAMHALPSEIFKRIQIYSDELPTKEKYNQCPVIDSLWIHEAPKGYAFWEYAVYTLVINE